MTFQSSRAGGHQKMNWRFYAIAAAALGILLFPMPNPQIVPALIPLATPVSEIKANPKNTRRHNKRNIEAIRRSLEEFGQQKPIVIDADGQIIAGHGFFFAAKALGWDKVAAVRSTLTGAEAQAYGIADNRASDLSENDADLLAEVLEALERDNAIDITVTGFSAAEIHAMIDEAALAEEAPGDPDAAPPLQEVAVSRLGDVWTLGPHRLACGDCTDPEMWAALLGGRSADLVFTDPPYNMNFKSKTLGGIQNDHLGDAEFTRLILSSSAQLRRMLREGGSYYVCMSPMEYCTVGNQMKRAGLPHQLLIWKKPNTGLGAQEFRPQFELMLYGHTGKKDDRTWNGRRSASNFWELQAFRPVFAGNIAVSAHETEGGMVVEVSAGSESVELHVAGSATAKVASATGQEADIWEVSRDRDYVHPTQKPVELVRRAVRYSSSRGDLVADLFAGSGTTLIAAHLEKRLFVGTELDPRYADVICRRWMQVTGIEPVQQAGKRFSEVQMAEGPDGAMPQMQQEGQKC